MIRNYELMAFWRQPSLGSPHEQTPTPSRTTFSTRGCRAWACTYGTRRECRPHGLMVCADMAAGTNWRITDTKLMNIGYTFDEAAMIVATATVGDCSVLSTVHPKT